MFKIKQTIGLLVIFTSIISNAQVDGTKNYPVWIDMMEQPNVNMVEARKNFDTYWENNMHQKGDKSKSFERWYTINVNRLDQFGNVISADRVKSEFKRLKLNADIEQQGSWFSYGPNNVGARPDGSKRDGGRVKHISFHPAKATTYFISCFKSGLFKTVDDGKSWIPLTDQLTEEVYISAVDNTNPKILYIGTNLGVLKTIDGGQHWNETGLNSNKTNALLIQSNNPSVIIVGNSKGIFRSENAGVTFKLVKEISNVEELRIHPTNPQIMYAGTNAPKLSKDSKFLRSVDGGKSWQGNTKDFGGGTFMKIAVSKANPAIVYVINSRDHLGQDSFEGVYKSIDSGVNFKKQSGDVPCITGYKDDGSISRGQPNYDLFIVADQKNPKILYAGGVKSWKSTDGGVTWTQVFNEVTTHGHGLHLDQLTWAYSSLNNRLFALNDGGIYYLNKDDKFQSITDGLSIAEVFECTQSQQNKTNVAGGTMHCGIKLNKEGIWYTPWGGDEATCLYDYSDDQYMYHFKYDKVSRSFNGGMNFKRINRGNKERGEYTGTGVLHKGNVNTLVVGMIQVQRTTNAREKRVIWSTISSFEGKDKIQKIDQSDADNNVLYVARGSSFYRTDDLDAKTPNFIDLTNKLPITGAINDIATHPNDKDIVYVLLGSKIYKSKNKGLNWEDISFNLPKVGLLEMIYDKTSDEGIYLGTDLGVYYKNSEMNKWVDFSKNLPARRISGMDIYYGDKNEESAITISTDGRGFWRSQLYNIKK